MARGRLLVNGERLDQGDGVALDGNDSLAIEAVDESEFLLFDMG